MTTSDTTLEGKLEMENSTLTTADNSILEKASPAPASIHSNNNIKTEETQPTTTTDDEDETQYPPMLTKVGVGVGLALAVFLVLPPSFYWSWQSRLSSGRVRSDNCRNCYS
jgi:hypothetical protein